MSFPKNKRYIDEEYLAYVRTKPCIICFKGPSQPHHIKTVGAGGPDMPFNLMPLCNSHHRLIHDVGLGTMWKRFDQVKMFLDAMGWEVVETESGIGLFPPEKEARPEGQALQF